VYSDYSYLIHYSSNPAVFTDAYCYLDWIAAQYGLSLPSGYTKPTSCDVSSGDKLAAINTNCLSRAFVYNTMSDSPVKCQFTTDFPQCKLFVEVFTISGLTNSTLPNYKNVYYYYGINTLGQPAICANDCPGVDPNAVVVGGEVAVLALATGLSAGPSLLGPALGGVVGAAGLGLAGVAMSSTANRTQGRGPCPLGQCRVQRAVTRNMSMCCDVVVVGGRQLCPLSC
jgi:hypothetical protein